MVNEQMLVTLTVRQLRQLIREEVAKGLESQLIQTTEKQVVDDATMTIEDVAKYLKCSKATVHNYINNGRLPKPNRVGRKVFWDRVVVLKHIDA